MKLLLVLCVVMFTRSAGASECPAGYIENLATGRCFYYPETTKTYLEAESACSNNGNGHVIRLKGVVEEEIASGIIGDENIVATYIWVGLTDENADGEFVFTDGTHTVDENWQQPPTADSTRTCVSRNDLGASGYLWYPSDCEIPKYFICEADKVAPVPPCHARWTYNPDAGTCVRVIRGTRRTYTGASSYCKGLGGELATKVTTLKERKRIMKLMTFQGHIFIGVDDKDNDGTYEYIDGTALGGQKPFRKGRSPAGRCVTLKRRRWYPKSCTRKFFFACEKAAVVN